MKILILVSIFFQFFFSTGMKAVAGEYYTLKTPETHYISSSQDGYFSAHDGTKINYNISLPSHRKSDEKFPLVILLNPLGVPAQIYLGTPAIDLLVKRGIAVALMNTRGHYKSEGVASVASENEIKDVSNLIDHILKYYPIKQDSIGVGGVSNGAGLSLFAAAEDSRIKTVIAGSPWTNFYHAFYENNSVNRMWAEILPVTFTFAKGKIVRLVRDLLLSDPMSQMLQDFSKERDTSLAIKVLNEKQVPVFVVGNLDESLFQLKDTIKLYESLNVPKKLEIGRGDHAVSELVKPIASQKNKILRTPCPDNEKIWFKLAAWYLYWLKGIETDIMSEARISAPIKFSECKRVSFDSFDMNTEETKLYFSSDEKLVENLSDVEDPKNKISVTFQPETFSYQTQSIFYNFVEHTIKLGNEKDIKDVERAHSFVFKTQPFADLLKLRTTLHMNLNVAADHHLFHLYFYVFRKPPNKKAQLLSITPYTNIKESKDGIYNLNFEMDFISQDLEVGDSLYVVADTAHRQYLMNAKATTVEVISNTQNPSFISFKSDTKAEFSEDTLSESQYEVCTARSGRGYGRFFNCGEGVCAKKDASYTEFCLVDFRKNFQSKFGLPYCRENLGRGIGFQSCPKGVYGVSCASKRKLDNMTCIQVR